MDIEERLDKIEKRLDDLQKDIKEIKIQLSMIVGNQYVTQFR